MTNKLSQKPHLTGRRIELHPFNEKATEAMLHILRESEVLIKTGSISSAEETNTMSDEDIRSWYAGRNDQTARLDLAIYSPELDEYVGEVVFNDYSPANKSVNYRIAIGSRGRGRGYGTEATQLMINYGFQELEFNRIELEVYEFNAVARHVYTSCGFVTEGRRRQALYLNGRYYDAIIKSILRSDWLETKTPRGWMHCNPLKIAV